MKYPSDSVSMQREMRLSADMQASKIKPDDDEWRAAFILIAFLPVPTRASRSASLLINCHTHWHV
jgi:hypothetical protein